jgi:hypothetical protein
MDMLIVWALRVYIPILICVGVGVSLAHLLSVFECLCRRRRGDGFRGVGRIAFHLLFALTSASMLGLMAGLFWFVVKY